MRNARLRWQIYHRDLSEASVISRQTKRQRKMKSGAMLFSPLEPAREPSQVCATRPLGVKICGAWSENVNNLTAS